MRPSLGCIQAPSPQSVGRSPAGCKEPDPLLPLEPDIIAFSRYSATPHTGFLQIQDTRYALLRQSTSGLAFEETLGWGE